MSTELSLQFDKTGRVIVTNRFFFCVCVCVPRASVLAPLSSWKNLITLETFKASTTQTPERDGHIPHGGVEVARFR